MSDIKRFLLILNETLKDLRFTVIIIFVSIQTEKSQNKDRHPLGCLFLFLLSDIKLPRNQFGKIAFG